MNLRTLGAAALCLAVLGTAPALAEEPKSQGLAQKQDPKPAAKPAVKPIDSRTAYNMGAKLMERQDWKGALDQFSLALQSNPGFVKAYVFRGVCFFMLDNPQRAVSDLDKALEFDPENPEGLFYRGQAWFFLGSSKTAIKDFDRFLTIFPENGPARLQKAMSLYRLRDYPGTVTEASRSIAANPRNADAFAVRGGAYWRQDMLGPANDDFKKAAELKPDNALYQLLSYLTQRLSGEDARESLAAYYAKASDPSVWPYPAVGMYLGKVSPPEVLRAGERAPEKPYLKGLTKSQACFFVAYYFKLNKNEAKYEEYMQKAAAEGTLYMIQDVVKQRLDSKMR